MSVMGPDRVPKPSVKTSTPFGSSAGRWKAIGRQSGGCSRAIGHLDRSGNRAFGHIGQSGVLANRAVGRPWPIGQSGIQGQSGNGASKANPAYLTTLRAGPIGQSGIQGQSGNRASRPNRAIGHPKQSALSDHDQWTSKGLRADPERLHIYSNFYDASCTQSWQHKVDSHDI